MVPSCRQSRIGGPPKELRRLPRIMPNCPVAEPARNQLPTGLSLSYPQESDLGRHRSISGRRVPSGVALSAADGVLTLSNHTGTVRSYTCCAPRRNAADHRAARDAAPSSTRSALNNLHELADDHQDRLSLDFVISPVEDDRTRGGADHQAVWRTQFVGGRSLHPATGHVRLTARRG